MATHSSILVWIIPWTEEPGGLQSMGSQRIGHDIFMFRLTFSCLDSFRVDLKKYKMPSNKVNKN